MKRRQFVKQLGALSGGLLLGRSGCAETPEQPLPWSNPRDAEPGLFQITDGYTITKPGRYYLEHSIRDSRVWTIEGWKNDGRASIDIRASSVELDFRGHTLRGIHGPSPVYASAKDSSTISLRNGTIDYSDRGAKAIEFVHGRSSQNLAIGDWFDIQTLRAGPVREMYNKKQPLRPNAFPGYETRDAGNDIKEIIRLPRPKIEYLRTDFLFENMTLKSGRMAMLVEGSHTIIRNCTIESGGIAGIFIAGPNVTIENCTIRQRPQSEFSAIHEVPFIGSGFPRLPDEILYPGRAGIVLRDGSHAVIRNNRFRIDYTDPSPDNCFEKGSNRNVPKIPVCPWKNPAHCILVQDAAQNVLIEGNTFINIRGEPISLSEGTEAIVRDNKREKRWL